MILPKFREYNYYHEARSKPGLILFWIRDIVTFYKKEAQMFIDSGDINIYEINRIDIVVGGYQGRGLFSFPMKVVYIMNNGKRCESVQPVGCILCKKGNDIILKNITIKDLGGSIN